MTRSRVVVVGVGLVLLLAGAPAAAQEPVTQVAAGSGHQVAVTFSPIHLLLPVGEVMAEIALARKLAAAAILGAGTVDGISVYEGGAQVNYYLVGDFDHGMQLGLEAMYLYASESDPDVTATGAGMTLGPYVGYKLALDVGFTFNAQLGVQAYVIHAEASSSTASAEESESKVAPLLNLNVGWSF